MMIISRRGKALINLRGIEGAALPHDKTGRRRRLRPRAGRARRRPETEAPGRTSAGAFNRPSSALRRRPRAIDPRNRTMRPSAGQNLFAGSRGEADRRGKHSRARAQAAQEGSQGKGQIARNIEAPATRISASPPHFRNLACASIAAKPLLR
jgi:hypothetical protein